MKDTDNTCKTCGEKLPAIRKNTNWEVCMGCDNIHE